MAAAAAMRHSSPTLQLDVLGEGDAKAAEMGDTRCAALDGDVAGRNGSNAGRASRHGWAALVPACLAAACIPKVCAQGGSGSGVF